MGEIFDKKKILMADLALLMVAFIWGAGFLVVKDSLSHMTPLYLMGIRFIFSALAMALIFFNKTKQIRKHHLKSGVIVGIFLYVAFAFQTVGLQYTTVSNQAFLTGTNVVMVPFLVWIVYKKRPDAFSFIGAILCVLGIGLLTLGDNLTFNPGDILTLVCAFFFGCHITSVGHFAKKEDPIILTITQFGVCAILMIISAVIIEPFPTTFDSSLYMGIGYMVMISTVLAFGAQNVAQKYTPATHAALILCLEAVFGSVLAVIFRGEGFSMKMLIGCIIIFCAIIITETKLEFLGFNKAKKDITEVG